MKISIKIVIKKLNAVKKISKITKAMRIIAITKAKKELNKLKYFALSFQTHQEIFQQLQYLIKIENSQISQQLPKKNKLWLVFSSDLGFCLFYNTKIFKTFLINFQTNDLVIVVGQKGIQKLKFEKIPIFKQYLSQTFLKKGLQEVVDYVFANIDVQFDTFQVIYTQFTHNLKFLPKITQLLPLEAKNQQANKQSVLSLFTTEGSAMFIYQKTIAIYLKSLLYFYYVNSRASEEKARQFAMNNASENAQEMLQTLKLKYNQLRQEKITREILDLSQNV